MSETDEAVHYVSHHCTHIGSFSNLPPFSTIGNVFEFLTKVGKTIGESPDTSAFPGRTREHVAYAVSSIANFGFWSFLSPPCVLASTYLLTRLEFYFRILSGSLNPDGTWVGKTIPTSVLSAYPTLKGKKRINNVSDTYNIMKLNTSHKAAIAFDQLDNALSGHWSANISNVGERIEYVRHSIAHGEWGDPSSEAVFYCLVTAIVFYNQ